MGTLAQLAMLGSGDIEKVARFFAKVGLPIHLEQISVSPKKNEVELNSLVETALSRPIVQNMPCTVDHDLLKDAILTANQFGLEVSREVGDEAYKRLHKRE